VAKRRKPLRDKRGRFTSRSRTGSVRKPRGRSASRTGSIISRKIAEHSKAVTTIGRERLKPGSYRVTRTRFIKPSARGMAVLRDIQKSIQNVRDPATFTYGLEVKGPDGKIIHTVPAANIIPRSKRERALEDRYRVGELTSTQYTRQLFAERVRAEVFRARMPMTDEQYQKYVAYKKTSPAKARKFLQGIIRKTGVSFRVEVIREI